MSNTELAKQLVGDFMIRKLVPQYGYFDGDNEGFHAAKAKFAVRYDGGKVAH